MATITKKELVESISANLKVDLLIVRNVLEDVLKNIKDQMRAGNRIEIRDFGVFEIKVRKARVGRNPKKPENVVTIPERRVVHFKVGRELKKLILQQGQGQISV